jgi:AcrR family transcriptional regulator
MTQSVATRRRPPLTKGQVYRSAVALADSAGIESLSMRKLAEELGVVPMALYKHVADKEALLDGMVDVVVGEIDPPISGSDWKGALRQRILSARRALLRHPWASQVIESRTNPTPALLGYMDSMMGLLRAGGFSIDLTHHVVHALGSRLFGFAQEVFHDSQDVDPETQAVIVRELSGRYPNLAEVAAAAYHDEGSVVGQGCDDQFEFEFGLDLLLEGFEKLRQKELLSKQSKQTSAKRKSRGRSLRA